MSLKLGKRYGICVFVLLIMVFIVPSFAGAFPPDNFNPEMEAGIGKPPVPLYGLWRNPEIIQELKLTDEQIAQIKKADFGFREKSISMKAQLDSICLEMEKAFSTEPVDEAAVLKLAQKIADLKGKMFVQGIVAQFAFEKLLAADQLGKLRAGFLEHNPMREKGPHHMEPFMEEDGGGGN